MSERGYELKGSVFTMTVLHLEDALPEQIQQLLEKKPVRHQSSLILHH
jgi:septum site-determining protein MinC